MKTSQRTINGMKLSAGFFRCIEKNFAEGLLCRYKYFRPFLFFIYPYN